MNRETLFTIAEEWFEKQGWKPFAFQTQTWTAFLQGKNGLLNAPTGSGKTTTLFSMLKSFDPHLYNISTLEDPVEYNIPYINQTKVRPEIEFDFATGLRHLVRQDPDIIMV